MESGSNNRMDQNKVQKNLNKMGKKNEILEKVFVFCTYRFMDEISSSKYLLNMGYVHTSKKQKFLTEKQTL